MTNQNEDNCSYVGRVLFMVLFLLVICAHFDKSEKQTYFAPQYELITEMHSLSNHAVFTGFIQAPVILKSLATGYDKTGFSLFNENFKLFYDNRSINRKLILIQKNSFNIKPACYCRFQYHLFRVDTGEPPLLS